MKHYSCRHRLSLLLSLTLCLALPGQAMARETITGTAHGNNGRVSVTLEMDGRTISAVTVNPNLETPDIGAPAALEMGDRIWFSQRLSVDLVSGATVTSSAVISAAIDALESDANLSVISLSALFLSAR